MFQVLAVVPIQKTVCFVMLHAAAVLLKRGIGAGQVLLHCSWQLQHTTGTRIASLAMDAELLALCYELVYFGILGQQSQE